MLKCRHVELTLQDKINLIKESEHFPKPSQKSLSQKFGVGKTSFRYFKTQVRISCQFLEQ
jgi:hypothetical protein